MYRKRKKCFLCDTLIYYNRAACKEHAELYNQYKDEQWCRELVSAENKQSYIESKESISLHALNSNTLLDAQPIINAIKPVQSKSKDVINLYESGMTRKEIAEKLDIKINTVKVIIWRANNKVT
jgi:DNA-binding NarL/FixJ family response regulator